MRNHNSHEPSLPVLDHPESPAGPRTEFLANAAHELRSPLAALRTTAEVALANERSVDDLREALGVIIEECASLGTLVNRLLLLAEGDSGRLKPGRLAIRLDTLVSRAVEMFAASAEENGVELRTMGLAEVSVRIVPDHLREVMHQLLDNALRFTPAGGQVTVSLWVVPDEDGGHKAVLRVADTGCGVSPEDLPHLFEPFYQVAQARTRSQGGNGLGLSVCRSLVRAYGGTIRIDSSPGHGTVVSVTLPVCDESLN
jgi:signal transduction histidine kinase